MKDGYGQSIRERKVLKSVRPQSSRKNNKKNQKNNLRINVKEESKNINNQISNRKHNINETIFQNQILNSNQIETNINWIRLKSSNPNILRKKIILINHL